MGECIGTEQWPAGGLGRGAVYGDQKGEAEYPGEDLHQVTFNLLFFNPSELKSVRGHLTSSPSLLLSNSLYPKFLMTLLTVFLTLDLEISGYVTCQSAQGYNSAIKKDSMREKF